MILPGATLGVLGGGQLGRLFTLAARTLGYRVMVLDPDPYSPAGELADMHLKADYSEPGALDRLAHECAAVTTEFENVPAQSLEYLAQFIPVRPSAAAVALTQDRIHEKGFLAESGCAGARFAAVHGAQDLAAAVAHTGLPALLKTSRHGYDGKGQARVASLAEAERAFAEMGAVPCVLEELVGIETELSVVLARAASGGTAVFPVTENRHVHGILDVSIVPARVSTAHARQAEDMARSLAAKLDYCGVLAVEFFVAGGKLLVNELAPRPHNSGHYTIDACETSQFAQQVRALCGLPLGSPRQHTPAVMLNLLGDLWHEFAPPWEAVLRQPRAKLHLYGKREARPGRKMGHVTCLGATADEALALAMTIRAELTPAGAGF